MKTAFYAVALWLLCGLIGEMLLRSEKLHSDQIALGPVTMGKGISRFIEQ